MSELVLYDNWPPSTSHNIAESPMELILGIIEYALTHKLRELGLKLQSLMAGFFSPSPMKFFFVFFCILEDITIVKIVSGHAQWFRMFYVILTDV